ncbi:MAG: PAS domain S-box protein, partial [Flammeovirgaceae bacterium]|nr:PAS domain S-box protein [Flammeovirgaceae bacterium]MDW8287651.1 PAS domain S-box protein [Flammeovirgaceae bacterium]
SKLPLLHEESFPIEEAAFPHFVETEFGNAEKWTDSDIYFLKKIQGYLSQLYERKCQEEHEKNNIFKLLLQNSSDVVAIIEENFDIRFVSDSAWEVFGVSPQEVIERNVEMIHPDDLPLLADFLTRAKESTQKVEPFVYRVKHKTGDYIYLETVASNQLHNLFIRGLVVNSRDITERQKTKEKLLRFEKIVESLKDGVLILEDSSKNYAIMYANPAFYQITGLVEKDVLHQSGVFFLKKDATVAQWKEIQDALAHEQETSFFLQSTHSSGRKLLLNIQLYPIPDALENKKKFILIVQDITSQASIEKTLKEYAEKLRKSNEELETFAYIASHDLQEPLRTVIGFTELIAETYAPHFDKEGLEYVQFVLQASRRMKNLIQDLLRFSRVGTGKEYIEEVNMNEVFRTAYDNLYNAIEENHAIITSEILPTILANFTLLLQVMQNLLSNAIKYRKPSEHPIIHVGCEEHPDEWVFSVKDNGIGIPKKYHDRVFVIFQRLHTQEKFSGTGIGLAICKKVVEKYGGRIWLYSEEGKGSTFYFSVPKELKLL